MARTSSVRSRTGRGAVRSVARAAAVALLSSSVVEAVDTLRRPDLSFKGPIAADAVIPGWNQAGHATRVPSAEDFIRIVPAIPLAYGSVFSSQPIPFDQWTVEIAFRIHGATAARTEGGDQSVRKEGGKGGRGLAFWYTKDGTPTPPTIPAPPVGKAKAIQPVSVPSLTPNIQDRTDPQVSLFGNKAPFEGLGVLFDTQPNTPVNARSRREFWPASESGGGASPVGVVSGVMDDGRTQTWVTGKKRSTMAPGEEAEYLSHTIGDCEAAFRNAPGLVWARISHHSGNISVDLDLSPHTSLSLLERHYSHRCFEAENVQLPAGYHIGLTALASPNDEPDTFDVYAIEVREVVKGEEKHEQAQQERRLEEQEEKKHPADAPLQGTTASGEASLVYEMFSSQARMLESIAELTAKVGALTPGSAPSGGEHVARGEGLDRKLDDLIAKVGSAGTEDLAGLRAIVADVLARTISVETKLETLQSSIAGFVAHSTKQTAEIHMAVQKLREEKEARRSDASAMLRWIQYLGFATLLGCALYAVTSMWRAKKGATYVGDEGSFVNGSHGRGNSISLAMNQAASQMGFRQRGGKKMI